MRALLCLVVVLAIASCSASTPLHISFAPIPYVTRTCPAPAPSPIYPPKIMSVPELRLFAQEADAARIHDRAALHECAIRLRQAVEALDAARGP